jgi:uncharacterized protein YlzI (FlbEa/FlbD family)
MLKIFTETHTKVMVAINPLHVISVSPLRNNSLITLTNGRQVIVTEDFDTVTQAISL